MTRPTDQDPAARLLDELATIRTLLDESFREEDIPLLDDPVLEDPVLEDPVLDDPMLEIAPGSPAQPAPRSATAVPIDTDQPLLASELDAAIRDGIDAAIRGWLEDTLPRELDILRGRLLATVRSEVSARLASHLNSPHDGEPAPPAASVTEDTNGQ